MSLGWEGRCYSSLCSYHPFETPCVVLVPGAVAIQFTHSMTDVGNVGRLVKSRVVVMLLLLMFTALPESIVSTRNVASREGILLDTPYT